MITQKEIQSFWWFYWMLMLRWNLRSFLAFISTAVIWDFISKNYLGSKKWYSSMNDTKDGDFGAKWWLLEKRYNRNWWSAFNWWMRNHSWNYIRQFDPPWYGGQTEDFLILKNTLNKPGKWLRADKEKKLYGKNYIAYRIDGEVFCQYSFANKWFHLQVGAGGSEYRFRIKL